jgi:cyclopropane fatty-acyl-phospholipid synthase-like methyltransferase
MYRLMYRFGFTPWDKLLPAELARMITGPEALPPGRALDMGSGNGTKAIFMATHGWHVTGVEAIPRAITESRRRAGKTGVTIDFREGDVTRLEELHLEPGFDLIFDFGCYHGLKGKHRDDYVRGVNSVAADGAKLLMMAFTRPSPPITTAVTESDLIGRFGRDWTLAWSHPDTSRGTSTMVRAGARWFCLVRTDPR